MNGTKSYYKYHPWLNAHPTNAISPFAESCTRQVRVSQQPFLSSLQDRLHPVLCILFIDGQLWSPMESLSRANYRIAWPGSSPETRRVARVWCGSKGPGGATQNRWRFTSLCSGDGCAARLMSCLCAPNISKFFAGAPAAGILLLISAFTFS